jgi:large-conductance mechanosensitive channel
MQTLFTTNPLVHVTHITSPFFLFLTKFNIVPLAFSLIISLNLNQLSNTFTSTIIAPIINKLFNNNSIALKDRKVEINGITLEYGLFLVNLIQFLFTLLALYFLYLFYNFISNDELKVTVTPSIASAPSIASFASK